MQDPEILNGMGLFACEVPPRFTHTQVLLP